MAFTESVQFNLTNNCSAQLWSRLSGFYKDLSSSSLVLQTKRLFHNLKSLFVCTRVLPTAHDSP